MFIAKLKNFHKLRIVRSEQGFSLVEVVISITLLGIIAGALFMGLSTSSKVLLHTDARETAKNLAETQMEFVKGEPFILGASTYAPATIPAAQQGTYNVAISVIGGAALTPVRDNNLQKITVTITGLGVTYTLDGYKVR